MRRYAPIVLDVRLKIPLAPVSESIATERLAIDNPAVLLVRSNLAEIHIRQGISRGYARRVTESEEALVVFVDIGRRIDVVVEEKETCFHGVRAMHPDQIVFDGGLRVRIKE